jgi:SAM-dependent methyltransferase
MDTAPLEVFSEHSYSDAVAHYTSAQRRDPVKTEWEEPFSIEIYRQAVARLGSPAAVSVLDVGCGTGDGLSLISKSLRASPATASACLSYVGIDNSSDMILKAREIRKDEQTATFIERDVREGIPECPFDLYLSCGVPYSHLTEYEFESAIVRILSAIRRNQSRSAIIIDVLGRFSIEWPSMWARTRWPYRMSFFTTDSTMQPVDMSFYSSASLSGFIDRCAKKAGVALESKQFYDRSIAAGRHTTTGEYNDGLPPMRDYVNSLYTEADFDLSLLYLPPVCAGGFTEAESFHQIFRTAWNATVRNAENRAAGRTSRRQMQAFATNGFQLAPGADIATGDCDKLPQTAPQRELAGSLRRLEYTMQPGLGVGHSLVAVVVADGRTVV